MKLFDPPCRNPVKSVPRGKAIWNANGGFVSVLLTHLFIFIFWGIDLSVYVLYLSVPPHALTFIAYVCCLHMFKCCVVCKFNMI